MMKTTEARREAARRWGPSGFARCPDGMFTVGCGSIVGRQARSWEAAFAEAEQCVLLAGYLRAVQMLDAAVPA